MAEKPQPQSDSEGIVNSVASSQRIRMLLNEMGFEAPEGKSFEVIQEYLSGASTYRVHVPHDAILKVARPESGRLAMERAHRELSFYRELAGQVPVRTPAVLAHHEGSDGIALLLAAYRPSPGPQEWPAGDYVEVVHQLGRLHAAFWDKAERLVPLLWLKRRRERDAAAEIEQARLYWRALQAQDRLAGVLNEATWTWLHGLLLHMPSLDPLFRSLPLTLCHGDCIPANVLRADDGQFVWADWQEVRLAHGPEDLGFFLQRAAIAGANIPADEVWAVYHESLAAGTGQALPPAVIRRVGDAADLWSRALYWPAYMGESSEADVAAMLQQIQVLAERLGLA